MMSVAPTPGTSGGRGSALSVLAAFLKLGLTSFGGPVAHIGYFRAEFVERRKWLDEASYVDLVALCQFLPGPASSQVGLAIGILRAGLPGALCAWLGFTLPSAIALIAFAHGVTQLGDLGQAAWLHGLEIVAVAVVAQAVWGMARTLCPDRERATMAVGAAVVALYVPSTIGQIGVIVAAALIGWRLLPTPPGSATSPLVVPVGRGLSLAALAVWALLLVGLPLLAHLVPEQAIKLVGPTAEILNNQGYSYLLRGDHRRARAKLLAAQAKDPSNPYIQNNLALLDESFAKRRGVQ